MRHKLFLSFVLLTFVFSLFITLSPIHLEQAYAKPPDWAPAHGYRNKKGNQNNTQWKQKQSWADDDKPYYWTFVGLDRNGDHRISLNEWNESKDLFILLDQNHDGYVSRAEYIRIDEQRGLLSGFIAKIKEGTSRIWHWFF